MIIKKHRIYIPFLLILLFFFLTEGVLCAKAIIKNKKEERFTQTSLSTPLNTFNKVYVSIRPTKTWTDENNRENTIFECIFENTTNKSFRDWKVDLKTSEETKILSVWNCQLDTKDEHIILSSALSQTNVLKSNSSVNFGFIINSEEKISIKPIIISGRYVNHLIFDPLFWVFLVLICLDCMAISIIFLNHRVMTVQKRKFHEQKQRDDAIIDQTIKTFVNFIDAKDEYTKGHSARVAKYAKALSAQLGFDEKFQKDIYYMGLMHDIGKLSIPDEILNKTTRLSSEEWEIIQLHTTNGVKMLKDFNIMPELKDAVLYHHERYDGKGYVNQLKGESIPIAARIICIVDSFDAMNTNRCYRLRFTKERIITELERCSGKQFDPKLVPAMIEIIRNGTIDKL